jgi:hypothetical protein
VACDVGISPDSEGLADSRAGFALDPYGGCVERRSLSASRYVVARRALIEHGRAGRPAFLEPGLDRPRVMRI